MRHAFGRAAAHYDEAAFLARETGQRMAERLDYVRLSPTRMADVGCATGDGIRALQARYPDALPLAVDYAHPMLAAVKDRSGWFERLRGKAPRLIQADAHQLPLAAGSLDLVWSNLVFHWIDDLRPVLAELHRLLAVGGLLTFTMLGPDTLKELRLAARQLGRETPQRHFLDMHDVGDLLVHGGFSDPVMDTETLRVDYRSLRSLLRDQRCLGVRNELFGQADFRTWRRLLAAWEKSPQGFPASFEVIYGHAWKAEAKARSATLPDGRAVVQFHRQKP